jgi:UDP-N-acetylmuramate dehydrogenase
LPADELESAVPTGIRLDLDGNRRVLLAFSGFPCSMSSPASDATKDLGWAWSDLPDVEATHQAPLANHTTLRIGGPAEWLVRVRTEEALARVRADVRGAAAPFRVLGLGSNVLFPDEGVKGVVALLEGEFLTWIVSGTRVEAGAGLPLARLVRASLDHGLVGLEALAGFPSTIGGAVVMNAGCYGVEIRDVLQWVSVLEPDGERRVLLPEDLGAGYRTTRLLGSDITVLRASFQLRQGDVAQARARMKDFNQRRRGSMPSGRPNAGSVFKNPPGESAGRLLDACGLKGERIGDAVVSHEHANVIVNHGRATASDVLDLMEIMHRRVAVEFGIRLEPELILVGDLRSRWNSRCG